MYGLAKRPWPIGSQPATSKKAVWKCLPANPGVEALLLAGGSCVGDDVDDGAGDRFCGSVGDGVADVTEGRLDSVDLSSVLAELCCLLSHLKTEGATAVHLACLYGRGDVVASLLPAARATLAEHYNGENSCTPLHVACSNGHLAVARLMLDHGAPLDAAGQDRVTPLCVACMAGHASMVEGLLAVGADPNGEDAVSYCSLSMSRKVPGCRPLHAASLQGDLATTERLLDCGADVDA